MYESVFFPFGFLSSAFFWAFFSSTILLGVNRVLFTYELYSLCTMLVLATSVKEKEKDREREREIN